ncbi:MAG TPA: extracellular solute-binding protein [Thiobacillus sp.]|nr:MAG: ABC transporter substrate-binding protein [Hydrogenophilales bacterium 28-61-11]OYZ56752.1 MAG: ABC transporter substrate-binding protein [Hydrogenophilales bacterium 16-61-112]OZA48914.1 MAG: ABC transporter substrate-binding protein [Hydrogenophilales bacterium 17-61-76]HQT30001.1 extracellular solute-binding protein [Thiobacillus sp.]HQT70909.1 extracellular solute-binding protein [Thiobacillus sp.]
MKTFNHAVFSILIGALTLSGSLHAQDLLHVYGPGGPAPAMKEAAAAFEKQSGHKVEVTAGPTPTWLDQAKSNADVVFSGSETMMTDFVLALDGQIDAAEVRPLYLRPLAILVRPGNPKRIKGLKNLLAPGVKVLVVNGAGQNGVWEDMAGRKGDINTVKRLRSNIVGYARNSAEARQQWIDTPDIDAWLIWNIWQVANPTLADSVKIDPEYAIYRDTGVVLTTQGKAKASAQQFIDFLSSPAGARIFAKWGWIT